MKTLAALCLFLILSPQTQTDQKIAIPQCTAAQADAGLCLPGCITWEQHKAEVRSWWAAPERVYVRCDDPRVGPPTKEKNN